LKKWTQLDQGVTPDGKAISLFEHDGNYSIRIGGAELMSTRQHGSEEVLAQKACTGLAVKSRPRVLIGGLGFGYTLKAALDSLSTDAVVVVAELMEPVIRWNQDPKLPLAKDLLKDPRVKLVQGDVSDMIAAASGSGERFDAIILDVDNGPDALSTASNRRLYLETGLSQVQAALKSKGCVAYWSAGADPAFAKLLGRVGFTVETERARARLTAGGWHTLYFGRRRS
jgi:spermidine synthase